MLGEFKNNKNVTEITMNIFSVYSHWVITDRQARIWFSKFHSGDTSLRDDLKSRGSSDLDQDAFRELIEFNQRQSTWKLALDLNTS